MTNKTWIGKMPSCWEIQPIGTQFVQRKLKVSDVEYSPLSVTKSSEGVVPQLDHAAKSNAHDDRKMVMKGDFVINSRSDRKMSCGVSNYDGSVSLINTVLVSKGKINSSFSHYLFKNVGFAEEFYRWGHGIVADLWTTNWEEMKSILIPVPSQTEQEKIVKILNVKISQIDKYIENQKRQILNFKNQKTVLIRDVTSSGIRDANKFTNFDNIWIKTIPEGWNVLRFKFLANMYKGSGISKDDVVADGNALCVRYGEIYTKYNISFDECLTKTNLSKVDTPQYFTCGDILFTCTGELVEEIGKPVVYLGKEKCLAGGDIVVAKHNQDPLFMAFALNSEISQKQRSYGKAKLKVVHISADQIGNTVIALPPIEEQREIGLYLQKKCMGIDSIIACKEKKIEILEQYKKSMIYEYVTGKKRVGDSCYE